MDERVHEQVRAGVQPEELAVNHMRQPGERMPVGGVKGGEGPGNPFQRQAADDHRVVPDVEIVIEVDELMTDHLRVDRESGDRQRERNPEVVRRKPPRRFVRRAPFRYSSGRELAPVNRSAASLSCSDGFPRHASDSLHG